MAEVEPHTARILIVEDDEASRRLITGALGRAGHDVVALADGELVPGVIASHSPDLAILDLNLGSGPNGHAIARLIRASSDVPIMFLSGVTQLEQRLTAFAEGSEDYLIKPVSLAELLARIDAVLRRTIATRRQARLEVADLVIDLREHRAWRSGADLHLTKTEFGLLAELARRSGRVVSKADLLARVWGYTDFDVNVVEVAVSSLRKKLEANGSRLVHTVRGAGYIIRAG